MTLRVIGAGLGRTGTVSLKLALEKLLGGPCYHMIEVFGRPDHVTMWHEAFRGRSPDWNALFEGFDATVDMPSCHFWRELSDAYPDAPVLLSFRDADAWWRSADRTILEIFRTPPPGPDPWRDMATAMLKSLTPDFLDPAAMKAAFDRHNDEVRATVPRNRLIEWRTGDGWEPICSALGLPVPDEPFPHANTTDEFRAMRGLDGRT
jgi:hypothetical protein